MSGNRLFVVLLCTLLLSCNKGLHPVKYNAGYYNINDSLEVDSTFIHLIRPYKDSLDKEMHEVIAISSMAMPKGKPESLMGNFIANLMLEKGAEYLEDPVEFSVMNYGGLRIPELPNGEITKGKVFELMPFDNFLVIVEINGEVVKVLADHIAANGGWPVAGIKFKIKSGVAEDIIINGKPLKKDKIYKVAISDYLADGGDNLSFLKLEKRKNLGVFLRDIILEYLNEKNEGGEMISSKIDQRIIIVDE